MSSNVKAILNDLETRNAHEPEFLQAVSEVLTSLEPVLARNPKYREHKILERILEPERSDHVPRALGRRQGRGPDQRVTASR